MRPVSDLTKQQVMQTLFLGYRPFLGRILGAMTMGLIGRMMLLGNANLIGFWVDSLCQGTPGCRPVPSLFTSWTGTDYLHLLITIGIVGFCLTISFRVAFSRWSAQAVSQIYDEVTLRTSRFPMSFFDNNPTGRIVTRFSSDYGNVFRLFGGPLAEFISIMFDLLAMLILITIASPLYLVFVLGVAALNYLVYQKNRGKLSALRRDLSASRSPSISHFAETTQGASAIRSFQREDSFSERFHHLDLHYLFQKLKTTKSLLSFSFQMNALSAFLLLITGVSAIWFIQKGWVSVGSVGVAFTFIVMSGNTMQMFFEWLSQLEEALIGVERLDRYLRSPIEDGIYLPEAAKFPTEHARRPLSLPAVPNSLAQKSVPLKVDHLWFRYQDDLPWVLQDVSFEIPAGQSLGVIGRTGSGKSSLIQALFRLYPVEKGQILINDFEALTSTGGSWDLETYRKSIALISQDPILFQGTLRGNLDPQRLLPDQQILEALTRVGLAEWALSHPDGLHRKIEERGKNLSLGERQLICMARCLLQSTPIVILDEATSAVDPQSEELLVAASHEVLKGKTRIMIAHRLSTIAQCDQILWLENGRVRKIGPASEILTEFQTQG